MRASHGKEDAYTSQFTVLTCTRQRHGNLIGMCKVHGRGLSQPAHWNAANPDDPQCFYLRTNVAAACCYKRFMAFGLCNIRYANTRQAW